MNANELADELDKYKGIATRDAATMLRQQQAEIEALKTYKPNQTLECSFDLAGFKPLAKTLTDEEINKIYLEKYDGHMGFLSPDEVREFAREILRKTQEK